MDANANNSAAAGQASPIAGPSNALAGSSTQPQPDQPVDMIGVLGNLLKSQTGEQVSNERMAQILLANMTSLVKQGKLNQSQILQVRHGFVYLAE
jgi:transcription initiation factor TFIID subunit 12